MRLYLFNVCERGATLFVFENLLMELLWGWLVFSTMSRRWLIRFDGRSSRLSINE